MAAMACIASTSTVAISELRPASFSSFSATRARSVCIKSNTPLAAFQGLRAEKPESRGTSSAGFSVNRERQFSVRAAAASAPAVPKQKIRIKLRSYWTKLIRQATEQILEAAKNTGAETMGPVPLPTHRRIYCLLRSPHVDKDSREHFEIRTHKRMIDLINPNAQTIDALMQLDLPAGVDVEVKLS
eukprot:jgi/Mesen1/6565/ME000336S05787